MATITGVGLELAERICWLLKVDPKLTKSIHIDFSVNETVSITVKRYAEDRELTQIVDVFEALEWKKK